MAEIGHAYLLSSPDSVFKYGDLALDLSQKIKFDKGEAGGLNTLGAGFQLVGDYSKSLEYLYKSMAITEKKNYVFEAAVCYEWIGATYWYLADYSKSIIFYKKSKELFEKIINRPGTVGWINFNILSIGQAYLEWNQLDSAYHYLLQYYNATLNDTLWHSEALYLLGDCMFKRGNRVTALNYLRESISGATSNGDYYAQTEGCYAISRSFRTLQQPDSVIYYAKKGLAAAYSYQYELGIYKNSKLLADAYEQLDTREALHYWKIYDSVNERMYGKTKVLGLQETVAEEQQRQRQIQEKQIEKENRLMQYRFIGGLVIMLLIALILFRNNLQRKKANVLLQQQKQKVETTLQELKSTQAQLIQSEKMASLGELTAGVAHEIQNPLNFVNNFSEVNNELADELITELATGNWQSAEELARIIKENEGKIIHHGQRAGTIVKSMLQHSRTSTGEKELADANAMCEEYLRLAYHGMQAKDKAFNAEIELDLQLHLPKIEIIPAEIGRALLNIMNNAFYAVSKVEKPLVVVSTKVLENRIEIKVKDNGSGIPEGIKNKIFQPFFTTKPSGQGTGLGLSLAYDIVKAHGGDIQVKSELSKGAEFIVRLPIV